MSKNLMIVESPNKTKTLLTFLDKSWDVIATTGHIRKMKGYDKKTLEPIWIVKKVLDKKQNAKVALTQEQTIEMIKRAAAKASNVYIATDPDREGEGIAWHVNEILDAKDKKKVKRITFNEVTPEVVHDAIKHPRRIDTDWVHAYFARLVLDQLVGYGLSGLLRSKLHAQSGGRVQSVALKFIYDREQEIKAFLEKHKDKWYKIAPTLVGFKKAVYLRELSPKEKGLRTYFLDEENNIVEKFNKDTVAEVAFQDEESAKKLVKSLSKDYEIYMVEKPRLKTSNPKAPFTTSAVNQAAIGLLGMTAGRVRGLLQQLFEGINIGGKHEALITYPRTDSTRISPTFISKAKLFIEKAYGKKEFIFRDWNNKAAKANKKNIQDAHEAIRVTDPFRTPDSLKSKIKPDEYRLYKIIWMRSVASLMGPSTSESIAIRLLNNGNKFLTHSSRVIVHGYRKVWSVDDDEGSTEKIDFSKFKIGDKLKLDKIDIKEGRKDPPPRFNQASLIKALEESGVGRPSTYNTMANVVVDRGYTYLEGRSYRMNPLGDEVAVNLEKNFPDIMNIEFTKALEEHLDKIADGDEAWKKWLESYTPKFQKELKTASEKKFDVIKPAEVLDEHGKPRLCPKCKSPLVERYSLKSHMKFIGCSAYPLCDFVEYPNNEKHHPQEILEELCPLCGSKLAYRYSHRDGKKFIACTGFPKCRYTRPANMTAAEYEQYKKDKASGKIKPTGKKASAKKVVAKKAPAKKPAKKK